MSPAARAGPPRPEGRPGRREIAVRARTMSRSVLRKSHAPLSIASITRSGESVRPDACSSRCAPRSTRRSWVPIVRRPRRTCRDVDVTYTSEYPDRIRPLVRRGPLRDAPAGGVDSASTCTSTPTRGPPRGCGAARAVSTSFTESPESTTSTSPAGLPMGFEYYDRVAFINQDRMQRYLDAGVVTRTQAALVGYPKLDRLALGRRGRRRDPRGARSRLLAADGALRADLLPGLVAAPGRRAHHQGARRRRLQRHREAARPVARSRPALHRGHRLARAHARARTTGPRSATSRDPIRRRTSRRPI